MARLRRVWALHIWVSPPALFAMSQFADLVQALVPDPDPFAAYRLLQGLDNKTLAASRALWQLSRKALAVPGVYATLAQRAIADLPAALAAFAEGRAFLAELAAYLQEYGRRGDRWDLADPSWIEDPTPALKALKDYVMQPDRDLEAEMAAVAAERERWLAQARARLQAQPQFAVAQFESWLKAAQAGSAIIEDHGFYIDYCVRYQVRQVLLELGRRLVAAGTLDRPDDTFYLTVEEVRALADLSPSPFPERGGEELGAMNRALTARQRGAGRRAEMDRFRKVSPPPVLGAPPA